MGFLPSCLFVFQIRSLVVFLAFLTITYYFQPYMFPIGLLLLFLKNYIIMSYLDGSKTHHPHQHHHADEEHFEYDEEDGEDDKEDKEEKKSLKARLQVSTQKH